MNPEEQPKQDQPLSPPEAEMNETSAETSEAESTPVSEPEQAEVETPVPDALTPDQVGSTPVEPMPAENEPQPQSIPAEPASGMALGAKKPKGKFVLLAIIVGALLVVLGGAWATYALWYNNPDNAVNDAFSKVLSAKSGSATGTFNMTSSGSAVKVDFSSAANESKQSSADVTLTITASGKDYKLSGHFAGTQDEFFVKLDDVRSVLTGVFGSQYSAMIDAYYGSLLNKIDGKWVVIKQSDLESLSSGSLSDKETQCMENEVAKLQTDASLRNELISAYKKNPLFTVEAKGSDSDGNKYSLTPVSTDKSQAFANAVVETKFFKAIDDCTSTDLKKSFTEGSDDSSGERTDGAVTTLEVWVDGWSHNLNKVAINAKDDSTQLTGEIKPKFNNNPSVTIPKGETTFDQLKTEIESITSQMLSGM